MQAVILAAGESSRFWPLNQVHKSLFSIMGRPLVWYTIKGLQEGSIDDIVIIQGPNKDLQKALLEYQFPGLEINYIVQPEPKGMGDALWHAKDIIQDEFFVLNAERFDAKRLLQELIFVLEKKEARAAICGQKTQKPWLFGIMNLDGDKILGIVEKPNIAQAPSDIKIVGGYFLTKDFFNYYERVMGSHYDFEDALNLYVKDNDVRVALIEERCPSLKYPWDILEIAELLMKQHLESKISKGVEIASSAILQGTVFLGEQTRVLENAVIKGPCFTGSNSVIGNNSLIRGYADLGRGVVIGANCELARSLLRDNVHAHSGYIGDSVLGEDVRVGAGVITANRRLDRDEVKSIVRGELINTGLNSLGVVIGPGAVIGVNDSLMPGILIGQNAVLGPHSWVNQNIEDDTLFYTKFEGIKKINNEKSEKP